MTAPAARTVSETEWRRRAGRLAHRLVDDGVITDLNWADVMASVPRHTFIPAWWALDEFNAIDHLVDAEDPGQHSTWLDGAYDDRSLVTRWEPGESGGTPVRIATSSVSQPSVVATLLDRLQPRQGMRILEIGTGSGYNAALLCARVGDHNVTSVDIDPELVDTARDRLSGLGMYPHLQAGDGADPPGRPGAFDRIVATCAVSRIPSSWTALLADGGRIVAPTTAGGALAVLDRIDPTVLRGRIDPAEVRFMSLRTEVGAGTPPAPPTADPRLAHVGTTDLDPARLDDRDFALWLAMHDPDLRVTMTLPGNEIASRAVYTATVRATVTPDRPGRWQVVQQGGRPWDTVEAAWRSFERVGRPKRSDVALTIDVDQDVQYFHLADGDERFPLAA